MKPAIMATTIKIANTTDAVSSEIFKARLLAMKWREYSPYVIKKAINAASELNTSPIVITKNVNVITGQAPFEFPEA